MVTTHQLINELIENYNNSPGDGIRYCLKKLQRDPNNTAYQIARAWFLYRTFSFRDALQCCHNVRASKRGWWEPGVIAMYQRTVASCQTQLGTKTCSAGNDIVALWKEAYDALGPRGGQRFQRDLLESAINDDYWDVVQQLFAWLQKDNPNQSHYHFTWIAATHFLACMLVASDPKKSQMLSMLAYKSLSTAVSNSRGEKGTIRKISSAKELRLLSHIYRQQGRLDELLMALDDSEIGITSNVGKNDFEFTITKIWILKKQHKWRELFSCCIGSLEALYEAKKSANPSAAQTLSCANDWLIWSELIDSANHLDAAEQGAVDNIIAKYLELDPQNRNVCTARLLFKSNTELALSRLMTSPVGFEDLRMIHKLLGVEHLEILQRTMANVVLSADFSSTAQAKSLTINALKILYHNGISHQSLDYPGLLPRMVSFLHLTAAALNIAWQREETGWEDICIMHVMTLLWLQCELSVWGPPSMVMGISIARDQLAAYSVQALCILCHGREASPSNYQLSLLSARLTQFLGLSSLALVDLDILKLKEVQFDSLGHLVYTRISTLHPFRGSDKINRTLNLQNADPLKHMQHALSWFQRATQQTTEFMANDIQFDKLAEFAAFRRQIDTSFTSRLLTIESRRAERMADIQPNASVVPAFLARGVSDHRDFSTFPNFEPVSQEELQELLFDDSIPRRRWLRTFGIHDCIQAMMDLREHPKQLLESILRLNEHLDENEAKEPDDQLTISERKSCAIWDLLLPIVCRLFVGGECAVASKNFKQDVEMLVKAVQEYQLKDRDFGPLPHWAYLHDRFTLLELLKTCDKLAEHAKSFSRQKNHPAKKVITVDQFRKLQTLGRERADEIQKEAKDMKAAITVEGISKLAKQGETGQLVVKLVGEQFIVRTAKAIVDSAHDALDGILKVTV